MKLSLRKLECVIAVAETGNFGRAAERLALSQPSLSRTIAGIEAAFSVRLFDRGRSGVLPTRTGEALVEDARRLLAMAEAVERGLTEAGSGEGGTVRFGMGPLPASVLFRPLLAESLRQRPDVKVDCTVDSGERLLPLLADGQIDFAIFNRTFAPEGPGYSVRGIGALRAGLFVRAGHPLAGAGQVEPARLADFPLATGHAGSGVNLFGMVTARISSDDFGAMRELMLDSDVVFLGGHSQVAGDIAGARAVELSVAGWSPLPSELVLVRIAGRSQSRAAHEMMERAQRLVPRADG